jgi:Uma2 family endonuclease
MAVEHRLYTVEEFEQIADSAENAERLLELVNGEIIEKDATELRSVVAGNILSALWAFVKQLHMGRVLGRVTYHKPGDVYHLLNPDVSFSSAQRPVLKVGYVPEMPDLVAEVKSPADNLEQLRRKVLYFLANGTKLVWLVIPEKRLIEVYAPDDEQVLTEGDTLNGGDVLPGFEMPVRDVFADPMD